MAAKKSEWGIGKRWKAHTNEVDFLKGEGGFFGVKLFLTEEEAKRFRKDILECLKHASKYNRNQIEIHAHWGKKKDAAGFLLTTQVKN